MKRLQFLFLLFFIITISCQQKKVDTIIIGIQPYGSFDKNLMDTVSKTIERVYGNKVMILPRIELPQEAFTNVKSPRYRADKLIAILADNKPDSIGYILGLTTQDISTTKRDAWGKIKEPASKYADWGIFGLGYMPGSSCVVSAFRIKSPDKTIERLKKICIHELGHNMGLDHCESEFCAMADAAETIKTIDRVKLNLCPSCRKKID